MTTLATALLTCGALALGLLLYNFQRNADLKKRRTLRYEVEAAFAEASITRLPKLPEYTPGSLRLVREVEEFSSTEDGTYSLQTTRLYWASAQSYVLFICTAGQAGYIKLLSRLEAARHVRTTPKVLQEEFPDMVDTVRQ